VRPVFTFPCGREGSRFLNGFAAYAGKQHKNMLYCLQRCAFVKMQDDDTLQTAGLVFGELF
jgi:hypothetical protein